MGKNKPAPATKTVEPEQPMDNNKDYQRLHAAEQDLGDRLVALGLVEDPTDPIVAAGELLEQSRKRIAELEDEQTELRADVEDLNNAKNELANRLADLEAGTPPAAEIAEPASAPPPEMVKRERGDVARDVGPTFGKLDRKELLYLISEGVNFELVFSGGEYELVEFQPILIQSADLLDLEGRFTISRALSLRGADAPIEIRGAGLMHGGEQVAYAELDAPIILRPGEERGFNRSLVFA